jgi:hypothetical protein
VFYMERDMELARKILFAMEGSEQGMAPRISIPGYSDEAVAYHVWLLADAGLIKAHEVTHQGSRWREALPISLNWAGHDFIDAARSDTTWSKAMEKTRSVGGSLTFALLKQVLESLLKTQLGI